jgi:hypothetical protein
MEEIKTAITFNDSYKADGFQAGVSLINSLLKPHGLKVVAEIEPDFEHVYKVTIEEEY